MSGEGSLSANSSECNETQAYHILRDHCGSGSVPGMMYSKVYASSGEGAWPLALV